MIIGIDNDKLKFVADSNGKLVVTLANLTDAIVKKELLQNCVITRCKDCKNYLTDDGIGIMCQMHYYRVKPTDFCSWAERKDNETD